MYAHTYAHAFATTDQNNSWFLVMFWPQIDQPFFKSRNTAIDYHWLPH